MNKENEDVLQESQSRPEAEQTLRLDYSLETPEERNELVKRIIAATPPERLTPKYLEKLSDYIIFAMDKQERKNRKILTNNRMVTVNTNETSFEGLVSKLENGEDGIYGMITSDKNIIMHPKDPISQADLDEIPELAELAAAIKDHEARSKGLRGHAAYLAKKQLIAMRKDQYEIKKAFRKPMYCTNLVKSISKFDLSEKIIIEDGKPVSNGIISFFNPKHISLLLSNYSKLKEDNWEKVQGDVKWMIADLENLIDTTIRDVNPIYFKVLVYKIDGVSNDTIQQLLLEEFGITYSTVYISSLWKNKIPQMIAEGAERAYLDWYFTFQEKGQWKRCSKCGEIKLAHPYYFSKNKSSKDGLYSVCKKCRQTKTK